MTGRDRRPARPAPRRPRASGTTAATRVRHDSRPARSAPDVKRAAPQREMRPEARVPLSLERGGLGVAAAALERDAGTGEGDRGEGGTADEHQRVVAGLHQLI